MNNSVNNPFKVSPSVFAALNPFERAVLRLMERRGEAIIEDPPVPGVSHT